MKLHSAPDLRRFRRAAAIATGCSKSQPQQQQMPLPEVGVIEAKARSAKLTQELTDAFSATRSADVRARRRVLQKRVYTEGSDEGRPGAVRNRPGTAARDAERSNRPTSRRRRRPQQNAHVAAERARSVAGKGFPCPRPTRQCRSRRTHRSCRCEAGPGERREREDQPSGYAVVTAPIAYAPASSR